MQIKSNRALNGTFQKWNETQCALQEKMNKKTMTIKAEIFTTQQT
jgi:hypothetical protein